MKQFICLLTALCLLLTASTALAAAPSYDYPGKDFFTQPVIGPFPEGTQIIDMIKRSGGSNFDANAFINSEYGEKSSEIFRSRYAGYASDLDEQLLAYWLEQGVVKEGFNLENGDKKDDYYVYSPAAREEGASYSLVIVSHGGGANCFSVECMGFINMVPTEQFIIATAEDTSVKNLYAMYQQVTKDYPVDLSRVYANGTSMGGLASISFAAAYPERIAAIAPNDIAPSLSVSDQEFTKLQQLVMPMNFTTGLADKYYPFPFTGDEGKINGYNKLLSLFGQEAYAVSMEQSQQLANESMNIIEHATGLYLPQAKPVNYINNRLYVCDFANADGVTLLRLNIVENKPHMFFGYDAQNAWEFLKQFSRNQETGELQIN